MVVFERTTMKTYVVLTISERLREVLPPLTDDQRGKLEANILADGVIHDPICYWHDGTDNLIVDGMNRFEISEEHGIDFETQEMTFTNIEAVERWMLERQAGKRNLTERQLSEVRGRLYNRIKADETANLLPGGPSKDQIDTSSETLGKVPKSDTPKKTSAETVAEQFEVSPATVKRDAKRVSIIDNLNEGVKKSLGKTVHDAAMTDLQKLAKLDESGQSIVARAVRTGQAKTLKDALKSAPAPKPDKPKPGVKALTGREADAFDARTSVDGMMKTIDQWVRNVNWTIDKIRGEFPSPTGDEVLKHLQDTYAAMKKWKGLIK
jgi:hypothetical protein